MPAISEKQYEVFFSILDQIINKGEGSWQDRKEQLVSNAGDRDMTNLNELATWLSED